ncbi:hypothetical protein CTEN210_01022 [Chaetoceros tenuissimus]|uniref:Thiaminase-2/PQQC domain-containing protein n=1 Tax=Chaetoceros tenuissimus TaxID=426638 RepID=A0AAD3CF89_9STRA|nr:hypothetical protein CTEN210_01022 [Chaetoceros tenuissimus]
MEIIQKLRNEQFNIETTQKLTSHPYLVAAKNGSLTMAQRRAFVQQQYHIQLSDAKSFAVLAGHLEFNPKKLTDATVPNEIVNDTSLSVPNLYQFLLGGEIYASELLLKCASVLNQTEDDLCKSPMNAKAQGYPSYWARLALSKSKAAGAAACAVNFQAWGHMCHLLHEALLNNKVYGYKNDNDDVDTVEGLEFIKFFATPIENLDEMAADIIEKENVSYDELVPHVRMLQEYEVLFWDACYEAK